MKTAKSTPEIPLLRHGEGKMKESEKETVERR